MYRGILADRIKELEAFIKAVEDPSADSGSILLIYGESGRGKRTLLDRYYNLCLKDQAKVVVTRIDLTSRDPVDITTRIINDGYSLELSNCAKTLRILARPSRVEISGNVAIGSTRFTVVNDPISFLEEQRRQWIELAYALGEDLKKALQLRHKRFVMLFDGYDKADSRTQSWIVGHLLPLATPIRVFGLMAVLATQHAVEPSSEWRQYSNSLRLDQIPLEDWQKYAREIGSSLNDEQIRNYYEEYADNMIWMASSIELQAPRVV